MSNLSEKEKMIAGELYLAMDRELASERLIARQATHRYNATEPEQFKERALILKELLGTYHKTVFIVSGTKSAPLTWSSSMA